VRLTRGLLLLVALLALALALGVGSADARSTATVVVTVDITGSGTVTSNPAGITCTGVDSTTSGVCTNTFSTTSTIVLTATPAAGWDFSFWSGACDAFFGNTCQINPADSSHNVTANFTPSATPSAPLPPPNSLTVQVLGKGTVKSNDSNIKCGNGNRNCFFVFLDGVPHTLTATAADGWTFVGWSGFCGDGGDCVVSMDPGIGRVVVATFSKDTGSGTSTLSATAIGLGAVTGSSDDPPSANEINCGTTGDDCTWIVPTDSVLTLVEGPDPGNVFSTWGGDCSGTQVSCTVVMDDDRAVSATFVEAATATLTISIKGAGHIDGPGFVCQGPGTCLQEEPLHTTLSVNADPADGWFFAGWTGGGCEGVGKPCMVTMDADRSISATFSPILSVSVTGNGLVTAGAGAISCGQGAAVCSAPFAQGTSVTLVATPALGSTFTGWTGACGGTATTCSVLMSEKRSVTATFTAGAAGTGFLLTVSVSGPGTVTGAGINCGSGATTCTATPTPNSSVTLTATPSAGATFTGWSGSCTGTIPTCTVQMTAARSVTASFSAAGGGGTTVLLSVSVTGSGMVAGGGITCGNGSGACSVNLPTGSAITLTAIPVAGATFTGWSGACTGSAQTCTISMTSAKSVTAAFTTAAPGTLTITVNGKGTVSAPAGKCIGIGTTKTCIQKYAKGRTVALTASAAAGNAFAGWGNACVAAGKKLNCTLTLATAKSVTASFVPRPAGGGGGGGGTARVLTSLGPPIVRHTLAGYRVTLRFSTIRAGIVRVVGLRAGRVGARVTLRVAAGPVRIGPFTVAKPGLYTFQVHLGTSLLQWRVCLGRCGAAAPGPPFVLIRKPPTVTRSGDAWSVTLHVVSNQIAVARVRAVKGGRTLVNQRFLARRGPISIGPFLLGPGNYTLRLTATDAYGRVRTVSWIVALA
jgi:Divergent InlB B-repeat domain